MFQLFDALPFSVILLAKKTHILGSWAEKKTGMWILIPKANHVISKRRYSYLCLGAWFWTVWTRTCCIYIRAAFSYIISVEKVSFSSFFSWNSVFFTIPWRGHFETWQKIDSVTGKIDPSVEQIAIRSMTWNAAHMGLMVCGLGFLWAIGHSDWNPDVVQRSFRSRSEVVWEPRKMAK